MPQWFDASAKDFSEKLSAFLAKRQEAANELTPEVAEIISTVRAKGDEALFDYTRKWDRLDLTAQTIRVHSAEIAAAEVICPQEVREALAMAADRIRSYHKRQLPQDLLYEDMEGNRLGWQWKPLRSVGLYVPGGKAAYPSSVLMNAIPAQIAGVKRLAMVVPAPEGYLNPAILVAAQIAGISEIYKIGGAQAIAALAYGTQSVAPVAKIVGPGNAWVAEAQRQVFGQVGIDMIAGPSEICVVADAKNHPEWIAADLLSQAEHSENSQSILITNDETFARNVVEAVETILATLPRQKIAAASWQGYGAIILVNQLADSPAVIDQIAPEHTELAIDDPEALAREINCSGAIFLGRHTPEAFGDYTAGPSHVLPTNLAARFCSGLSVYNFLLRHSIIGATESGFQQAGHAGRVLAEAEGLQAHALSLQYRLK